MTADTTQLQNIPGGRYIRGVGAGVGGGGTPLVEFVRGGMGRGRRAGGYAIRELMITAYYYFFIYLSVMVGTLNFIFDT